MSAPIERLLSTINALLELDQQQHVKKTSDHLNALEMAQKCVVLVELMREAADEGVVCVLDTALLILQERQGMHRTAIFKATEAPNSGTPSRTHMFVRSPTVPPQFFGRSPTALSQNHQPLHPAMSHTPIDRAAAFRALRSLGFEVQAPPDVVFDTIVGNESAKNALWEFCMLPLLVPAKLMVGSRRPCASMVLHGPPGTGKTSLAHAAANALSEAIAGPGVGSVCFLNISPSAVLSMFQGESERLIRRIFRLARAAAPTVLLLDEIDGLGATRDGGVGAGGADAGGRRMLLSELLVQLEELRRCASNSSSTIYSSGTENFAHVQACSTQLPLSSPLQSPSPVLSQSPYTAGVTCDTADTAPPKARMQRTPAQVLVLAATNKLEDVDSAILRRFERKILVALPSWTDRVQLVHQKLEGITHSLQADEVEHVAARTEGWNCSEIEELVRHAVMRPIHELAQHNQDALQAAIHDQDQQQQYLSAQETKTSGCCRAVEVTDFEVALMCGGNGITLCEQEE